MKDKFFLFFFVLLLIHLNVVSQNPNTTMEVMAVEKVVTPSFEITFEYDQWGNVISENRTSDENYLKYKFEYEYDAKGNIIQQIQHAPYSIEKEENIYNDNSQIIEKKLYSDYGSGFKHLKQYVYTYQDDLLSTILFQIVSSSGQHYNSIKQEFIYNEKQQPIQIIKSDWANNSWIHVENFDFEYNEMGDLLTYANVFFDNEVSSNNWRYCFTYNNEHEIVERNLYYGSNQTWNTRPFNKYLFMYDQSGENETLLFPNIYQFDDINFNWFLPDKKLVKYKYWDADCSGNLYFVESADYFYMPLTIIVGNDEETETWTEIEISAETGDKEWRMENGEWRIYPNPTNGELRILIPDIRYTICDIVIYDMLGRIQKIDNQKSEIEKSEINISHLPAGLYFIRITTEVETIIKKIIKQ